jgi:hypothetical protein
VIPENYDVFIGEDSLIEFRVHFLTNLEGVLLLFGRRYGLHLVRLARRDVRCEVAGHYGNGHGLV